MKPSPRPTPSRRLLTSGVLVIALALPVHAATTWTGATDTDWFDPSNWSSGIPAANDDVTIPASLSNYPVLDATGAICRELTVASGASLDLSTFELELRRGLRLDASNGISSAATGALVFTGGGSYSVDGDLTLDGDIRIEKNAPQNVLTFEGTQSFGDLVVRSGQALFTSTGGTTTTTLSGDVTVHVNASLTRTNVNLDIGGDVTLEGTFDDSDATGGGTSVAGDWTDGGTFTAGTQTVTFDGGATSTVQVPDASDFFDIIITGNTTLQVTTAIDIDGTVTIAAGSTFDVDGDLDLTGGGVSCAGRLQIGSTVTSLGTFTASTGTVEYDAGALDQRVEAVTYNDLEIDTGSFTTELTTTVTVGGDVTVTSGTLGVFAGSDLSVAGDVSVSGTLELLEGGILRLGSSCTIASGGSFVASGTTAPRVTNDGVDDYTFTVSSGATIDVRSLEFYNPEATGLTIANGATITNLRRIDFQTVDPDNDASDDTFLRILDTGANSYNFIGLSFDSSCTYNVETAAGSVSVSMVIPEGANGSETYELEGTTNAIDWPTFTRIWLGGTSTQETDWGVASNWSPSGVPTDTDDCLIQTTANDPVLETTGTVRTIYIDTGASLTIDTANTMEFDRDLIVASGATFSMTDGTLSFVGTPSQGLDHEGGSTITVADLTVDKASGTFQSSVDVNVTGDLTVTNGTVDVGPNTFTITGTTDIDDTVTVLNGTLDANGSFDATGGTVTFSGAGRLQLGGAVTSLGTFTANASTVEYDDTSADRTIATVTYQNLEIDVGTRTASAGGTLAIGGDLTVTAGTLALGANSVTVTGTTDVDGTLTLSTGTFDQDGPFDATGGTVTCTGAARIQLGAAVTSLGTFTAGSSTVEFDDQTAPQTIPAVSYQSLEIDKDLQTATIAGTLTIPGTLTMTGGTLDVGGTFDATGGAVTFGAGRLELGGAVTSLGTFTAGSGTVVYDDTSADRAVAAEDYADLIIDCSTRVATTAGDITVSGNLSITGGELEVDDGDTLDVAGDITVSGTLDIEPGSVLLLGNASSLSVDGGFEAIGTSTALALISSSDTATPTRYSFSVEAGGTITAQYAYFEYFDASGIVITDSGAVTALAQFDEVYLADGATGGTLLTIHDNDDTVTCDSVFFEDPNGDLATNVATTSASATITFDPYGGDFGGATNEDDNGGGTVTPGFIVWSSFTPARLGSARATVGANGATLSWETLSERECRGFSIERALPGARFTRVGPDLVPARGTEPDGALYTWTDRDPAAGPGTRYRIVEIGRRGGRTRLTTVTVRPAPRTLAGPSNARNGRGPTVSPLAANPWGRSGRVTPPVASTASAATSASASATPGPARPPMSVRLAFGESGIARVDHGALASTGWTPPTDPDHLRLRRGGKPWPITVLDGGDGSFDPGDAIEFSVPGFVHPETTKDVFLLDAATSAAPPARIPPFDGTPLGTPALLATTHHEEVHPQERYVLALTGGGERDHWFGELLLPPAPVDIPVALDAVAPGLGATTLTIDLEGWSDDPLLITDHETDVLWDGTLLGTLTGDGAGPYGGTLEVPAPLATDGPHVLTLAPRATGTIGVGYLDRFSITGPRWHVARAGRARASFPLGGDVRLEGFPSPDIVLHHHAVDGRVRRIENALVLPEPSGTWAVECRLPGPGEVEACTLDALVVASAGTALPAPTTVDAALDADWVAIVPRALRAEIVPLARHRRGQGLRTAIVDLEDVEAVHDGGRRTTTALARFIGDLELRALPPAPRFVLLVGDATYDPAGHLGPNPRQVLPTPLARIGGMQTASDGRLADLDGDGIAERAIGRLPVATAAECRAVVEKIIARETTPRPTLPHRVVVADDEEAFLDAATVLADATTVPSTSELLDLALLGTAPLRTTLLGPAWSSADVVTYVGHGARRTWADEGILAVADLANLPVTARSPIVVAWNCWNGFFQHPLSPGLGEALVLEPGRGAVAYFGPSAATTNERQRLFGEALHEHLTGGSALRLGDAIRLARTEFADDPAMADVIASWLLLGDPALFID